MVPLNDLFSFCVVIWATSITIFNDNKVMHLFYIFIIIVILQFPADLGKLHETCLHRQCQFSSCNHQTTIFISVVCDRQAQGPSNRVRNCDTILKIEILYYAHVVNVHQIKSYKDMEE